MSRILRPGQQNLLEITGAEEVEPRVPAEAILVDPLA